jgi:hypothetical protein
MKSYGSLAAAALVLSGCGGDGPLLQARHAPTAPAAIIRCGYGSSESFYTGVSNPTTTIDATGEVGTHFVPQVNGRVVGYRFFKASGETGTHTARLWSASGTQLDSATFGTETSSGWQTVTGRVRSVSALSAYVVSVNNNTRHAKTFSLFDSGPLVSPNLNLEADYSLWNPPLGAFPTTGSSSGFYLDVIFQPRICEDV